jgi:hypothetical protein
MNKQEILFGPADIGQIFMFRNLPDDCFLWFAVIRFHPDSPDTILLVPVDIWDCMLGACDVREDNEYLGPLAMRCGYSFWCGREDLDLTLRSGVLTPETVSECRQKLAGLARGNLHITPAAYEVEADPEYNFYTDDLCCWVEEVKESFWAS